MSTICEYCGENAQLLTGEFLYPHRPDLSKLKFWYCANDHEPAFVGCHKGTKKPLGRLANCELRRAKSRAHRAFDPVWKRNRSMSRSDACRWLSEVLGVQPKDCHIGMFDVEMCNKVVEVCG